MNLDYRGFSNVSRIGDKYYIDVKCDNCGAKYFIMEDDPDVPRMHRVCDTCFMPMVVKNWFYLWKRMAKGNGELGDISDCVMTYHSYGKFASDSPVWSDAKVRKWEDTEWHEPTIDYLGIE